MARERLYVVTNHVLDSKRWREVLRLLNGFGHWMQLSVFQCRLTVRRRSEMIASLQGEMNMAEDHGLIIDLGPADGVEVQVESPGKPYETPKRQATVV